MADRQSAALRFINAPWLKPFIFLVLIVVAWDIVIRVFKIPPYQIPAPKDVIITLVAGRADASARSLADHGRDGLGIPACRPPSAFRLRC